MRKLFSGLFIIVIILTADETQIRSSVAQRTDCSDKVCRAVAEDGTATKIHSPSGEAKISADLPEYAPDELIFKLIDFDIQLDIKPLQAQQNIQQRLQQVVQRHKFINTVPVFKNCTSKQLKQIHRAHLPADVSVTNAIKRLKDDPDIEWAEPQYYRYTQTTPNDPCYYSQKHLSTIKAPNAWDITTGDPNVIIAIIDTGVDYEHPDLAANIWINPGEDHEPFGVVGPEDFNRVDDDGNAYVDDILGWDFVSVNPDDVYPGEDPEPPDNEPSDFHGHGTHVAGIAGAVGNNGIGVTGVSWRCRIMVLRAGYKDTAGRGRFQIADIADALVYAADKGAHVINMSFGSTFLSQTERIAIDYAANQGCVLVASAGNDETSWPYYPASFNGVLSVAATSQANDIKTRFSNYGLWVDVAAPGESIYSTMPDRDYGTNSGTSMASPIAAGVAALIKSAHFGWSGQQIADQLVATSDDIDYVNYFFAGKLGGGRVNAGTAVGTIFNRIKLNLVATLTQDTDGDDDDELEPGETVSLYATIKNFAAPQYVTATLSTADPWVTIVNGTASYGVINRHQAVTNLQQPFKFTIDANTPADRLAVFNLNISAGSTSAPNERFELRLAPTWSRPHTIWADESDKQIIRTMNDGRLIAVMDLDTYPAVHDGIYATVRELDGAWTPLQRLSGTSGWSRAPYLDFGDDGDAHVVFERNNPFPDMQLFYTRYDTDTGSWSPETQLNTEFEKCGITGTNVMLSADCNGFIHVVWLDCRSGNNQIYYMHHDGNDWQNEQMIYDNNTANINLIDLFDIADGTRYMFFRNVESGEHVYYVMKGSGTYWQQPHTVTDFGYDNQGLPFRNGNHIYMLYYENGDLNLAEFDGADWLYSETLINDFKEDAYDPLRDSSLTLAPDQTIRFAYGRFSDESWTSWVDWMIRKEGIWSAPLTLNTFEVFLNKPKMGIDKNEFDYIIAKNLTPSGGGWYGDARPTYLSTGPIDNTLLPPRPVVTDDGITTIDPKKLHATWSSSHPAGIANYMYAVGTAPGQADIVDWIKFTSATEHTQSMTGKPLLPGQAYYVNIRAFSNAVYSSPLGFSDGITYLPADLDGSGRVDFDDCAILASFWQVTNCNILLNCRGADFEPDKDVDLDDLRFFVERWLVGSAP